MSMDVKVKIGNLKHIIIILKYQTKGVGENEVSIRSLMNHRLANEKKMLSGSFYFFPGVFAFISVKWNWKYAISNAVDLKTLSLE